MRRKKGLAEKFFLQRIKQTEEAIAECQGRIAMAAPQSNEAKDFKKTKELEEKVLKKYKWLLYAYFEKYNDPEYGNW